MAMAGSLQEALSILGTALQLLLSGQVPEALATLVDVLPAVGVFLVLYMFVGYILKTTLIKDDTHKGSRRGISLGLSFIGLLTVYDLIVNLLGTTFLVITILVFVIFGITIIIIRMNTETRKAQADDYRAAGIEAQTKRESKRLQHDEKIDSRRMKKERNDIKRAEKLVADSGKKTRTAESTLDDIRNAIRYLAGLEEQGQPVEDQRKRILEKISPLLGFIDKDDKDLKELARALHDLEVRDVQGFKIEEDEAQTLKNFRAHVLSTQKTVRAAHLNQVEDKMLEYVSEARQLDVAKKSLEQDIDNYLHNASMNIESLKAHKEDLGRALAVPHNTSNIVATFSRMEESFKQLDRDLSRVNGDLEKITVLDRQLTDLEHKKKELIREINELAK